MYADNPCTMPASPRSVRTAARGALAAIATDSLARLALIGLFLLAMLHAAYIAKPVLLPLAIAMLLALILSPAVNVLAGLGAPRPVAAAVAVTATVVVVATGAIRLAEPARAWLDRAPATMQEFNQKLSGLRRSVAQVSQAAQKVEELTQVVAPPAATAGRLAVAAPSLAQRVVAEAPALATGTAAALVLTYFMLASSKLFLRGLASATPGFAARRRAVAMARTMRRDLVHYLATVTVINAALGAATATLMYAVGLPNPVLWGTLAALLNFIPYAGAAITCAVVAIVGVLSFDEPLRMLLGPALFAALAVIEGQFLVPLILGRRFTLNPVVIVLATMLWGWLWGIAGALIAVPLLVALRITGAHVPALARAVAMMGGTPLPRHASKRRPPFADESGSPLAETP